jgi:hypothetical protein
MSGARSSKANDLDIFLRPQSSNTRELTMSLFTLVSSLLRPTTTTSRVQRQRPRTRLNLEALEDRRLLSHGFGLDDLQHVEVERPEPAGDTPSLNRGLDDSSLGVRHGRGNEGETGDRGRHHGHGKPANTPKGHPKRHDHVIRILHA